MCPLLYCPLFLSSILLSSFLLSLPLSPVKDLDLDLDLDPEVVIAEHLATMIKQKFDSTIADAIIPQLLDTPEWLKLMMGDCIFRKMLIDLYDQNRNSTLIKVALKEICTLGYHSEITRAIKDLDYFDVFNDSDLLIEVLLKVQY